MPDILEEIERQYLPSLLSTIPVEERLKGLPPEERLKGLSAEERIKGLSAEELLAALPPEVREALASKLKPDEPPAKVE